MKTSLSSATFFQLKWLPVQLSNSSPFPSVFELGPGLFLSPYCSYSILHLSRNVAFSTTSSLSSTLQQEDGEPGDLREGGNERERPSHLLVTLFMWNVRQKKQGQFISSVPFFSELSHAKNRLKRGILKNFKPAVCKYF